MNEFDIIKHYFDRPVFRSDVIKAIGDDAAIIRPQNDKDIIMTTDTLTANVHFFSTADPYAIGFKSLAVNLSDIAAMGAEPAWASLAISIPNDDTHFLESFSKGFFELANQFKVQLIGGDLTKGPLSITITLLGLIERDKAILRASAKVGDLIFVTGNLGDAGLALLALKNKIKMTQEDLSQILPKLEKPIPRIYEGQILKHFATSAIDLSDGLIGDLTHILNQSQVGAKINVDHLPISNIVNSHLSKLETIELALTAGDDYELCFTLPPHAEKDLRQRLNCRLSCIGEITKERNLILVDRIGNTYHAKKTAFRHF